MPDTTHYADACAAVESDFREAVERGQGIDGLRDESHEWADSAIPAYNRQLAEMLGEPGFSGEVDDTGLLPENPDAYNFIQVACYEQLYGFAQELINGLERAAKDEEWFRYVETDVGRYAVCDEVDEGGKPLGLWGVVDTPEQAALMLQGERPRTEEGS